MSLARQQEFEQLASGAMAPDDLRRRHVDYWSEFVRVDDGVPHTFLKSLDPVDLGDPQETQKIVRLESLTRPLGKAALSFERLEEAVNGNETAVVDNFLRVWNTSNIRDWRPAFAAFKDELLDTLNAVDWPNRMRDRLGLAHYDCAAGSIPVALMQYSVGEVRAAATVRPEACAVTAPTVLDSGPWPFFFPAPVDLTCGRTKPLAAVADEHELLAEILHFRITYRREHILRLAEIVSPPAAFDLKTLRNYHLLAVRLLSGRDDFGEEIP
ncbi:MAG: hypothetical protein JWO56_1072 [Acidobacteria bacterium]|nr:hypothetical protein [Acidobacteriota bacterium]